MKRTLERFSESIFGDLRNPRVLATVVILVLGIAAVLVLAPRSGAADPNQLVSTTSNGSASSAAAKLVLVTRRAPALGRPAPYGTADPFREPPVAHSKPLAASKVLAQGSPPATSAATGTAPTSSPTTTTTKAPVTPPPLYTVTRGASANLKFGISRQTLTFHKNVHGGWSFPSSTDVAVVFVGVDSAQASAIFLPSKGAVESGMGKCLPSQTNCEYFELKPGQKEHVLAQQNGGASTLYVIRYIKPGTGHAG